MCKVIALIFHFLPVAYLGTINWLTGRTDWTDWRLWINSGVRDGVAMAFNFGVPSDILIWLHFHSQATVPFVLAGVCWRCVNLFISDGAKLLWQGGPVDLQGGGVWNFRLNPPKSLSLCIGLLRNFWKYIPAPYKFHSPPKKINWCVPKKLAMKIAS